MNNNFASQKFLFAASPSPTGDKALLIRFGSYQPGCLFEENFRVHIFFTMPYLGHVLTQGLKLFVQSVLCFDCFSNNYCLHSRAKLRSRLLFCYLLIVFFQIYQLSSLIYQQKLFIISWRCFPFCI